MTCGDGVRQFVAARVVLEPADAVRVQRSLASLKIPLRITPPEGLHVTVHFLGERDERVTECVKAVMDAHAPVEVDLDEVVFNEYALMGRGKALALTLDGEGLDGLRALRAEVLGRLIAEGLATQDEQHAVHFGHAAHAWHPHLTVARAVHRLGPDDRRRLGELDPPWRPQSIGPLELIASLPEEGRFRHQTLHVAAT